jgi:hypothetical protein
MIYGKARRLRNVAVESLDIGGGIGIGEGTLSSEAYADAVLPFFRGLLFKIRDPPTRRFR